MDVRVIIVSIAILWVSSSWSVPARAANLLVSNQRRTRGDVPVYVTCDHPALSRPVPSGQKTLVEIPGDGDGNATSAEAAAKVWRPTTCMGTLYEKAHFTEGEELYVLYDSDRDHAKCKDVCFVLVTEGGFYRWDKVKRSWGNIFPIIWNN